MRIASASTYASLTIKKKPEVKTYVTARIGNTLRVFPCGNVCGCMAVGWNGEWGKCWCAKCVSAETYYPRNPKPRKLRKKVSKGVKMLRMANS